MELLCCSLFGNLSQLCKSIWHFSTAAYVCQYQVYRITARINEVPFPCALTLSHRNSHRADTHTPVHRGEYFFLCKRLKQLTVFQKENLTSGLDSTEVKNSFEGTCLFTTMWLWKQRNLYTAQLRSCYVTQLLCKLNLCKMSLFASRSCDLTDANNKHLNFHYE